MSVQSKMPSEDMNDSSTIAKLVIDVGSAVSAAWFAAPIVGSIDKATTQNMAGTNTMKQSIKEQILLSIRAPHRWITSWQCLFTIPVYSLTYSTVNIFDTYFERINKQSGNINNINTSNEAIKVSAVTAVNVSISIWKDRLFARKFGAILPTGLPLRAYLIFLIRDANQMLFTFTLPSVFTRYAVENNIIHNDKRDKFETYAQLTLPNVALIISVYLHLWALDVYNRRELKLRYRQSLIWKAYPATLGMFIIRCIPPFCIGPTLNTYFRRSITDKYFTYE
eukprot:73473_1